jgi:hypothetical protein
MPISSLSTFTIRLPSEVPRDRHCRLRGLPRPGRADSPANVDSPGNRPQRRVRHRQQAVERQRPPERRRAGLAQPLPAWTAPWRRSAGRPSRSAACSAAGPRRCCACTAPTSTAAACTPRGWRSCPPTCSAVRWAMTGCCWTPTSTCWPPPPACGCGRLVPHLPLIVVAFGWARVQECLWSAGASGRRTGARRAEMVGLTLADGDLDLEVLWCSAGAAGSARCRSAARPARRWTATCVLAPATSTICGSVGWLLPGVGRAAGWGCWRARRLSGVAEGVRRQGQGRQTPSGVAAAPDRSVGPETTTLVVSTRPRPNHSRSWRRAGPPVAAMCEPGLRVCLGVRGPLWVGDM